MILTFQLSQIQKVAAQVWDQCRDKRVWAFHGEMGAGKTTLIHALCDYLQVTGNVSSPTFAIINEYDSAVAGIIYHMDWYRMKNEEEAIQAGIEDCLVSGHYCWVEWPEKAPAILPDDMLHLKIEMLDTDTRQLAIGC